MNATNDTAEWEELALTLFRQRDALRERLIKMHGYLCTMANCVLDGGEEHEIYFCRQGQCAHFPRS